MQWFKATECTHFSILQDVPHQIWEGLTTSGASGSPLLISRLFHNKLRYYPVNYVQCYFHYLSPKFLYHQLGLIGLVFLCLALFLFVNKMPRLKLPILVLIAIYPLFFIFELQRRWP